MPYIKSLHVDTARSETYPFNVPAIRFAKNIDMTGKVTLFIGENGSGKSTLIESIACLLQLPHMDGSKYDKRSFDGAYRVVSHLDLQFSIDMPTGFFFRAEDFGDYLNSVNRADESLDKHYEELHGEVPEHIIRTMKDNANYQKYHVRQNYGQELSTFSHGEAYLKIIHEKIKSKGIFILDEPEAALSPSRQLALIHYIMSHVRETVSQFIIATHSPMLMAIPGSKIYEITDEGMMLTPLEETEHYRITKSFLDNPEMYLRLLG